MNLKIIAIDRWNRFSNAFSRLGDETCGMNAVAAAILFRAAASFKRDSKKGGYELLECPPPQEAILAGEPARSVVLREVFSGCQAFWDFKLENLNARISEKGIAYVKKHFSVFESLLESSDQSVSCSH